MPKSGMDPVYGFSSKNWAISSSDGSSSLQGSSPNESWGVFATTGYWRNVEISVVLKSRAYQIRTLTVKLGPFGE